MLSKVETRNQSTEYRSTGLPEYRNTVGQIKIHNPQSAIRNLAYRQAGPQSAIGFTLIELLVVVAIIALLVGILLPSLSSARKLAANVRTGARIAELAGGCIMYHTENEYYPGQRYSDQLGSHSSGKFTGSQWLAKSLFTDPDATTEYPKPKYCPLKANDLIDPKHGGIDTISDRNTTGKGVMPILYYPARLGDSGLGQYKMGDNSDYKNKDGSDVEWKSKQGDGTSQTYFQYYIKDRRFKGNGSTTPYNPGAFLIIAAGIDRIYGTSDDIRYPAFKSE